jgi:hypothetical protein
MRVANIEWRGCIEKRGLRKLPERSAEGVSNVDMDAVGRKLLRVASKELRVRLEEQARKKPINRFCRV